MKEFVEKLIERLEKTYAFKCVTNAEGKNVFDIIKDLASEHNNGWIPCEVELPPQPEENTFFEGKPLELYMVSEKGVPYPFRAFWNGKCFTDGFGKLDVVAWQPLPPAWKGE